MFRRVVPRNPQLVQGGLDLAAVGELGVLVAMQAPVVADLGGRQQEWQRKSGGQAQGQVVAARREVPSLGRKRVLDHQLEVLEAQGLV